MSLIIYSQNWELMNTAVLTGRQVSQAMKVFIVSQAGKVADVTLQSSCQAEDESVIKVSGCYSKFCGQLNNELIIYILRLRYSCFNLSTILNKLNLYFSEFITQSTKLSSSGKWMCNRAFNLFI